MSLPPTQSTGKQVGQLSEIPPDPAPVSQRSLMVSHLGPITTKEMLRKHVQGRCGTTVVLEEVQIFTELYDERPRSIGKGVVVFETKAEMQAACLLVHKSWLNACQIRASTPPTRPMLSLAAPTEQQTGGWFTADGTLGDNNVYV